MPARSPADIAAVLGLIAEGSPLAMAATEGETHLVRYANPAFCRLAGRARDAVLGRPLAEAVPALQEPGAGALLDRVYATGAAGQAVDLGPARDGQRRTQGTYTVWPILGDDHQPAGLLVQVGATTDQVLASDRAADDTAQIRDVNQRLLVTGLEAQEQAETQTALNADLREARAVAEEAVRARDEFLSIAAHELRTPLTAIKATAQLGLRAHARGALDLERAEKALRTIDQGVDRLAVLTNDLLDVSRIQGGQLALRRERLDLAALVRDVVERHAGRLEENHVLDAKLPDRPVWVEADPGRLEQVFENLLSNAVKYSPAGGVVELTLAQETDGAVVAVQDSGIGLPAGVAERIFEPFVRAPNAVARNLPGIGLGLHVSRQIVQLHSGRIWAESPGEERGATMRVWLPTTEARPEPAAR